MIKRPVNVLNRTNLGDYTYSPTFLNTLISGVKRTVSLITDTILHHFTRISALYLLNLKSVNFTRSRISRGTNSIFSSVVGFKGFFQDTLDATYIEVMSLFTPLATLLRSLTPSDYLSARVDWSVPYTVTFPMFEQYYLSRSRPHNNFLN